MDDAVLSLTGLNQAEDHAAYKESMGHPRDPRNPYHGSKGKTSRTSLEYSTEVKAVEDSSQNSEKQANTPPLTHAAHPVSFVFF
jgi:hypothetical protein